MTAPRDDTVEALGEALRRRDLSLIEERLADDVRWYGNWPGGGCHNREHVLATLQDPLDRGVRPRVEEARIAGDRVVVRIRLSGDEEAAESESTIWFALTLDGAGRITQLQDYSSEAAVEHDIEVRARGPAAVGGATSPASPVDGLVPFVHVTDIGRSVSFYRLLGLEVRESHEHEGRLVWTFMAHESAKLMLAQEEAPVDPRAQGVLFYLYARDLVALRDHLVAHGLSPGEIVDGTPGPKQEMRVTDPDGYCLMVAQIDDDTIIR